MNVHEALTYFDSLEPVTIDFMIGQWRGESYPTGHPWDHLLEKYHWYGKLFIDYNHVQPLLFTSVFGSLVPINPLFLPLSLLRYRIFRTSACGKLFQLSIPLFRAWESCARLRMVECRGKSSAALVYDRQPIIDVFRKIDENTVIGMMDYKKIPQPYFFLLKRD
ncbi:MAG: DUF4334 domain-containing protein [Spirochaetes bacterium]|nr:DUF4334 domain-containing protein [Spirochaetota bacterium]